MKLAELKIENFRSFESETIRFEDYTCLVGPNGSGKSAVLMSLNVFFQENASTVTDVRTLGEEDFHHKNIKKPVRITVTFEELSEAAQKEFKLYYRQGKLVVFAEAVWDEGMESAPVRHYGSRLVMKEFSGFFKADKEGKKVTELKPIYQGIRNNFPELDNVVTKVAMTDALRDYEEKHPKKCEFIEDLNQFYGFTKGDYHIEKYIQWVYVPAVKDASTEEEEGSKTALGQLLARTVRTKLNFSNDIDELKDEMEKKYTEILNGQKDALAELQLSLEKRLQDYIDARARLELRWHYDPKASIAIRDPMARARIGDGDFIGQVARAGHGMQRGFLLTILHELVGNEKQDGPKLLLGFEEPELYQHPPQAKHLADVLERLAQTENNAQIIVTTHSPYFVSSRGFTNIRMVRKGRNQGASQVTGMTYERLEERLSEALLEEPGSPKNLLARVAQIMQPSQNELFFTRLAIFVEGQEDIAFVSTQLGLSEKWSEFRRLGCHFVVAGGKTNMSRLVAIAAEFQIPFFVVFDADGDERNPAEKEKHRKDNMCLTRLCSIVNEEPFPSEIFWGDNIVVWPRKISQSVQSDFGADVWERAQAKAREQHDLKEGVRAKNSMLIAYTLDDLNEQSKQSKSLIKLCGCILRYAEKVEIERT